MITSKQDHIKNSLDKINHSQGHINYIKNAIKKYVEKLY